MDKKRIVVTGIGVVSCFGNDVDHFYDSLLKGQSGVKTITQFDVSEYPTKIAATIDDFDVGDYMDPKDARRMDKCIQYAMVAGKKAVHASNLLASHLDKSKCGVLIGSGMGGMGSFQLGVETLNQKGYRRLSPFFIPQIITNMPGALLAIDLEFMGPNYSVSTACATASYAIVNAANHIRQGHSDVMICGGTEAAITNLGLTSFIANKALSKQNDEPKKASRPWDQARDGFVMGEGCGVIVLETLEHAKKRNAPILAEYRGGFLNCDAFHMTLPRPDGLGVSECIKKTLEDGQIDKSDVNLIAAHATSTPAGDVPEILGLEKVFGEKLKQVKINAIKSMIGHTLGAAGSMGVIGAIKAIQTGKIHPTINLDHVEEALRGFDFVPHKAQELQVNVALSNSFGFGGHNACIAVSKFDS